MRIKNAPSEPRGAAQASPSGFQCLMVCVVALCLWLFFIIPVVSSAPITRIAQGWQTRKPIETPMGNAVCVTVSFQDKIPLQEIEFTNLSRRTSGIYYWPSGPSQGSFSEPQYYTPLGAKWLVIKNVTGHEVGVEVRPRFAGQNIYVANGSVPHPRRYGYDFAVFTIYVEGKAWISTPTVVVLTGLLFGGLVACTYPLTAARPH